MDWVDRPQVKKGNIGEAIVTEWLNRHGFVSYYPDQTAGAHPFDRLCASKDKRSIFIAEAKAKPKRKYYPDTGIDVSHYNDYKAIQAKHSIDVFLFFVDEDEGMIYGGKLSELEKPRQIKDYLRMLEYPLTQNGIIYFPRDSMTDIAPINQEQIAGLRALSTRKKDYSAT